MYAIVEIAGQQFKVEKNQEIFVHLLEGEKDTAVNFDQVLLLDQNGQVTVGTPTVNGAMIQAKIVEHLRGDKVIVFHKKRRKGYQKQNGHRQYLSKVLIEDILTDGKQPATAKKEKVKKEVKKETTADKEVVKKTKSAPKTEKTVVENVAEEPKSILNTPETPALEVEGKSEE